MYNLAKQLVFLFLFLLSGCSIKENNPSHPIVDFGRTCDKTKASQLIKINRLIKLETNDKCLIGHIDHADIYDGHIYILDTWISKSLFMFNLDGKFITKLTAASGGAGEFIIPYNFEIDRENKTLSINDVAQNRVLIYDTQNLRFIRHINKQERYNAIHKFPAKDLYVAYRPMININEKNATQIDILDKNLNRKYGFLPADPKTSILSGKPFNIYEYKNEVVVFPFFSNKLYTITPDTAKVRYELKFGEYAFPPDELFQKERFEPIPIFERIEKEDFVEQIYPYETEKHLLIHYIVKTNHIMAIYDKKNGKRINVPYEKIENDLGINGFPIPIFQEGSSITGYIEESISTHENVREQEDNPTLVSFDIMY